MTARDALNVDEDLLDEDLEDLEPEDLLALFIGARALERAVARAGGRGRLSVGAARLLEDTDYARGEAGEE